MRSRIVELDLLRAVAAVAVVLLHVTATPISTLPVGSTSFMYNSLINQWSRFGTPSFLVMTGITLAWGYGNREQFNIKQFFTRRVQFIGIPYLLWTAFYLIYRARFEGNWAQLPVNFLRAVVEGNAMYHLHFIGLIFQFYLLFPLMRKVGRSRWMGAFVVLAVAFQTLWMWDAFYGLFAHLITAPWALTLMNWRIRLFPLWIGYFMVGLWIGTYLEQVIRFARRWLLPLLGSSLALLGLVMWEYLRLMANGGYAGFVATGYRPTVFLYALVMIPTILGIGRWFAERDRPEVALFLAVARRSFGIFLVHPLVLDLTYRLLQPYGLTPPVHLLLVSSMTLGGSYLLSRLLAALPFGAWLVGK